MSNPLRVVGVSGSLTDPSRTTVLVETIVNTFGRHISIESEIVRLQTIGKDLAASLGRNGLPASVRHTLESIEAADLLIVATPVYRASFTGLFKHLFDFVDQRALENKPVLLAATGGSERHSLIIDHQLRPLFAFFQAATLPLGIYAHDADFSAQRSLSSRLDERIRRAVTGALPFLEASASTNSTALRAVANT